jgi:NAD(P)-dependent dehydrogenase (short-subunit alcohol dehydrogenase family)
LNTPAHQFNVPAYRISKVGLNMVTRILAKRLEGNICVSSIHPGWVKTEMGGFDADLEPSEVAEDILVFSKTNHESGQFWHKGEKFPW